MKWLRVQLSQQKVDLHVPDEVAHDFDLLHGIVRKFGTGKFFLDQHEQIELIQGIKVKIVSEVRFICNSPSINTYILGNKRP
jgi:hypothetical protein